MLPLLLLRADETRKDIAAFIKKDGQGVLFERHRVFVCVCACVCSQLSPPRFRKLNEGTARSI